MANRRRERNIAMMRHLTAGLCASVLLSGCFAGGYYDPGYSSASGDSFGSSSSSDTTSTTEASERSYVDRNGNIVFRKPGETTIVRPDGEVTIVQRDPDGTRTTVDSSGNVSVDPPGKGGRGRKD
jgi:hypothetical protein